jgi:TetR/AcrR family transcriptional repressor of mexJK operon
MEMPRDSRSAAKRRAIMEAATTVFLNKGYLGASMDDVAALAEVSKPTVYKHFADKEQLFAEIILATTGEVDEMVAAVLATLADTIDLERDLGELARRFIVAIMDPQVLRLRRLIIANADRFPDLGRTWYETGFERVLQSLATCFRGLADRGLMRVDDPLLAANHLVGLLLWIPVNQVMFGGESQRSSDDDLKRYADAGVRVFLAAYGSSRSATTGQTGTPSNE